VLGTPVEVIESLAPLVVERKCLRPDSGGAGKYRGGLGQTIAFRARTREPYTCSVLCDRTVHPAAGFLGGGRGAHGVVRIDGVAPSTATATSEPWASAGRTPRPYAATDWQSQPTHGTRASTSFLIAVHSSPAAEPRARWRASDSTTRTSLAASPSRRLTAARVASTVAWMSAWRSGIEPASKPSAYPRPVEYGASRHAAPTIGPPCDAP